MIGPDSAAWSDAALEALLGPLLRLGDPLDPSLECLATALLDFDDARATVWGAGLLARARPEWRPLAGDRLDDAVPALAETPLRPKLAARTLGRAIRSVRTAHDGEPSPSTSRLEYDGFTTLHALLAAHTSPDSARVLREHAIVSSVAARALLIRTIRIVGPLARRQSPERDALERAFEGLLARWPRSAPIDLARAVAVASPGASSGFAAALEVASPQAKLALRRAITRPRDGAIRRLLPRWLLVPVVAETAARELAALDRDVLQGVIARSEPCWRTALAARRLRPGSVRGRLALAVFSTDASPAVQRVRADVLALGGGREQRAAERARAALVSADAIARRRALAVLRRLDPDSLSKAAATLERFGDHSLATVARRFERASGGQASSPRTADAVLPRDLHGRRRATFRLRLAADRAAALATVRERLTGARHEAVETIRRLRPLGLVPAFESRLVQATGRTDRQIAIEALRALGDARTDAGATALTRALGRPDPRIQACAIDTMTSPAAGPVVRRSCRLLDAATLAALARCAAPRVRAVATRALASTDPGGASDAFDAMSRSPAALDRRAAAWIAPSLDARLTDSACRARVTEVVAGRLRTDGDEQVRRLARRAHRLLRATAASAAIRPAPTLDRTVPDVEPAAVPLVAILRRRDGRRLDAIVEPMPEVVPSDDSLVPNARPTAPPALRALAAVPGLPWLPPLPTEWGLAALAAGSILLVAAACTWRVNQRRPEAVGHALLARRLGLRSRERRTLERVARRADIPNPTTLLLVPSVFDEAVRRSGIPADDRAIRALRERLG